MDPIRIALPVFHRLSLEIVMTEIKDGDLKWATMIPLIGGSAIGCKNATGTPPVFNLSYSAFSKNEVHLKRYWPDVPHLTIDSDRLNMNTDGLDLDFVNSVCPCSGLSMLNVSRTGQVIILIFVLFRRRQRLFDKLFYSSQPEDQMLFKIAGCWTQPSMCCLP